MKAKHVILGPLVNENPVTLQILGICSALAITNSLISAAIMSLALTLVLAFSNVSISLLRHQLPRSVRIIVQMTIIASAVIVVDEYLRTFHPAISERLSVFVGLIITNCIILGRAEAFAMKNGPVMSLLDGIGNGLGYSLILLIVAFIRELFGTGALAGVSVLPLITAGGWFKPNELFLLPPSAFFIIGFLIWGIRSWKIRQVEQPEFKPEPIVDTTARPALKRAT